MRVIVRGQGIIEGHAKRDIKEGKMRNAIKGENCRKGERK